MKFHLRIILTHKKRFKQNKNKNIKKDQKSFLLIKIINKCLRKNKIEMIDMKNKKTTN